MVIAEVFKTFIPCRFCRCWAAGRTMGLAIPAPDNELRSAPAITLRCREREEAAKKLKG